MRRTKSDRNNNVPLWQSRKMKNLIAERWQEVWEVVEARESNRRSERAS